MADGSKRERGTTSPKYPLEEALRMLAQVHGDIRDGQASSEMLASSLGHQSLSGTAMVKIGSLTHFGLLSRKGGAYHISELGKRILVPRDDVEKQRAIVEAAGTPALYGRLQKEWAEKALPQMLENFLQRDYGVTSKNAPSVAEVFRSTMTFANLLQNGVLHSEPPSSMTPADNAEAARANGTAAASRESMNLPENQEEPKAATSGADNGFAIPVSKSRMARLVLPRPVQRNDLERIKKWLDLMEDVLTEEPETNEPETSDH